MTLKNESKPWSGEVAAAANDEVSLEHKSLHIENWCTNEEDMIAREARPAVVEIATNELSTMVDEFVKDILGTSLYKVQRGTQWVVYIVVEKVMLEVLRKDVIRERLDAHIAKFFDTNAPAKALSRRLLTFNSLMVPITTFLRVKKIQKWKRRTTLSPSCRRSWWIQYPRVKMTANHCRPFTTPGVTKFR